MLESDPQSAQTRFMFLPGGLKDGHCSSGMCFTPNPVFFGSQNSKDDRAHLYQKSCIFWRKVCGDEGNGQISICTPPLELMSRVCWGSSGKQGAAGREAEPWQYKKRGSFLSQLHSTN